MQGVAAIGKPGYAHISDVFAPRHIQFLQIVAPLPQRQQPNIRNLVGQFPACQPQALQVAAAMGKGQQTHIRNGLDIVQRDMGQPGQNKRMSACCTSNTLNRGWGFVLPGAMMRNAFQSRVG